MISKEVQNVTKLLWTGGWDSSFRLLQLVLLLGKKVQPFYIMDPERSSLGFELRAMQNIKSRLFKEHPELKDNILPTIFIEQPFIPPDKDISDAFQQLQVHAHFGEQYKWMAWYARDTGLRGLEVGAERAICQFSDFVDKRLVKVQENGTAFFKLADVNVEPEVRTFFQYFHFPIREYSKLDMRDIAIRHGFYHLMEMTWFCHHPRKNGKSCGVCTPCTQYVEDGIKFRLPVSARIRYHVRWLCNREQLKKDFPRFYRSLYRLKRSLS